MTNYFSLKINFSNNHNFPKRAISTTACILAWSENNWGWLWGGSYIMAYSLFAVGGTKGQSKEDSKFFNKPCDS